MFAAFTWIAAAAMVSFARYMEHGEDEIQEGIPEQGKLKRFELEIDCSRYSRELKVLEVRRSDLSSHLQS